MQNMDETRYRAYICFGPNCGPKGSSGLLDFLEDEVSRMELADKVSVLPTGCQAHCESGPTMVVYPGPVYYQAIDHARLSRIVAEHFACGQPVKEYFWTGVRKRILPGGKSQVVSSKLPQFEQDGSNKGQAERQESQERQKPRRAVEDVDDFKW